MKRPVPATISGAAAMAPAIRRRAAPSAGVSRGGPEPTSRAYASASAARGTRKTGTEQPSTARSILPAGTPVIRETEESIRRWSGWPFFQ